MFAVIFKQLFLKLNTNLGSVKKEEERKEVQRWEKKERKVGRENQLTLILTSASSSSSLYQKNNQIMHENTHKLNNYTFSHNQTHAPPRR